MAAISKTLTTGSTQEPRLRIGHALWSLIGLPMNAATEWTLDEKFSRVREAGFEIVECWLGDEDEKPTREALDRNDLGSCWASTVHTEDVRQTVERAVRLGADFVFAQPAGAYTPLDDVVKLGTRRTLESWSRGSRA
jgi:sugar phosphate isomerase/epimerase